MRNRMAFLLPRIINCMDKASPIGGIAGSMLAYFLNVELSKMFEVAIFAAIGAGVGEGVKHLVAFIKNRYGKR